MKPNVLTDETGKLSSGRLMAISLFLTVTSLWILWKFTGVELSPGDYDLIKWGWISAIGGKAIQKFAEKK